MNHVGIIERAFQLAATGNYRGIQAISTQLVKEGYTSVSAHLQGNTVRQQLKATTLKHRRLLAPPPLDR